MRNCGIVGAVASLVALAPVAALASGPLQLAQNSPAPQRAPAAKPASGKASSKTSAQTPAPAAPTRTEILNFDNWSVTCREYAGKDKRKVCGAQLRVAQGASRRIVFVWSVGATGKGLEGALVTPTGVSIEPGVTLKLGAAEPRRIGYSACEPSRCVARIEVTEAVVKEAAKAETAEATIQTTDGRTIKFSFPVKGLEKAVAVLRR